MTALAKFSACWRAPALRTALAMFERQVMLFPLFVMLLAAASFLCGGALAAWQWRGAVATAMLLPFIAILPPPPKAAVLADLLFAALLGGLFLAWQFFIDPSSCWDYEVYHLPATRLLIEGWNPIRDPDATGILSALGLNAWDMRYLHAVFLFNSAWVFNAASFFFSGNPFAIAVPLTWLLELSMLFAAHRFFRSLGWSWKWTALFFCVTRLVGIWDWAPLDSCVLFASGMLLFTMLRSLRTGRLHPLPLFAATVYLSSLKFSGLMECAIFWMLFAAAFALRPAMRSRGALAAEFRAFAAMGAIAFASAAVYLVVQFHPVVTSFQRYGHPLYPFMTCDPETHPVQNLTWDSYRSNADYLEMSFAAKWLNAYVSPRLVQAYYNRKLGRTDFFPLEHVWAHGVGDYPGPLHLPERLSLWFAIATLLLWRPGRLAGASLLAGMTLLPADFLGYFRYIPYVNLLEALAVVAALRMLSERGHLARGLAKFAAAAIAAWCCAGQFRVLVQKGDFAEHAFRPYDFTVYTQPYSPPDTRPALPRYRFILREGSNIPDEELHGVPGCSKLLNNAKLLFRAQRKCGFSRAGNGHALPPEIVSDATTHRRTMDELVALPGYVYRAKTPDDLALLSKPALERYKSHIARLLRVVFLEIPRRLAPQEARL